MTAWVKPTVVNVTQDILHNGANDGTGYSMRINSSGKLALDVAFVAALASTTSITPNIWTHVAIVRNSGTWQCYINGVANGSTITNNPNAVSNWGTLGASRNGAGTAANFFSGVLDDVRFYTRVVTPSELLTLVANASVLNGTDISSSSLRAWYKLDESSGNMADSSGNGLTMTAVNSPTYTTGTIPSALLTRTAV
jgi:hypothetical protein